MPARRRRVGVEGRRLAGGDQQLLLDQIDPGDEFGHGEPGRQPRLQSAEPELTGVPVDEEPDGPEPAVVDGLGDLRRRPP